MDAQKVDLIAAARDDHTEMVKSLLSAGADVNDRDKYGNTALMDAAGMGHTDTVKALLTSGADVNAKTKNGKTDLMSAAYCCAEAVKALLIASADPNAKNNSGETALMLSEKSGRTDIIQLLKKAEADK